jgi:hypothetical protein
VSGARATALGCQPCSSGASPRSNTCLSLLDEFGQGFAPALVPKMMLGASIGVWPRDPRAAACVVFACECVLSEEPNGSTEDWLGKGSYTLHEIKEGARRWVMESPASLSSKGPRWWVLEWPGRGQCGPPLNRLESFQGPEECYAWDPTYPHVISHGPKCGVCS